TDFLITRNNSFVFKKPGHYSYSSSKWVSVNKERLTVKPGEFKEVQIKIAVPKGVSIGGYYSAVLFETQKIKSKGTGVSVIARTGSVLLTAVGNENKINRVGDIKTLKIKTILNDGPAEPTVLVQNRGNVHLTLKGDVTFEDSFGRK
ncbi:MAG: hypothetical protein KAX16_01805, partial [Actinomycetia bacterium]|nr:hypothetical protein [Actinomycetes bacterium]